MMHGGDWYSYQTEYGKLPLDFSVNISPLGPPEGILRAAANALAEADRYPDSQCRSLRSRLFEYHRIPAEHIVCGNGAADLIYRLCRVLRPHRAIVPVPCFTEYERALSSVGCDTLRFPLSPEQSFRLSTEFSNTVRAGISLVFLCSPNNPSGLTVSTETLYATLNACRTAGSILALDECFLDFCEMSDTASLIPILNEYPELVIFRSFTKLYAMPGLRLGYALCGSEPLAAAMQEEGAPWMVSRIAEAAGEAALNETDYVRRVRNLIHTERPRLHAALSALGLRIIPGEANYLLFQSTNPNLRQDLAAKGILIRDCADYAGLAPGWYRTAIRTPGENDALLAALREVL